VNSILYISDSLLEDLVGGGELNDHELCNELEKRSYKLSKKRSHEIKLSDLNSDVFYIISNFVNLNPNIREHIQNKCNYIIYEHDHKYLLTRNPALYEDYKAPKEQIINKQFYENAKLVFCQSSFHEDIIKKNLDIKNIYNISGNIWSIDSLKTMKILSKKEKNDCHSVLNSRIGHKNTRETAFYCEKKDYKYNLISSNNYQEFLSLLSNNDKFIFLPKTPETLSRVVVEARMMNIKVTTNKRVGASYEPWFKMKGEELIEIMTNKRQIIVNKVIEVING
jgi:hypothetical protein